MIPVGDVIPSRTRPIVTLTIAAATILTAITVRLLFGDQLPAVAARLGVSAGEFSALRSVTAPFVHTEWFPLVLNVVALLIFGRTLEDRLGHGRFIGLLLLGCLAGAVTAAIASRESPEFVVGAGAAVGALAGAYLALFPRSRVLMLVWLPFSWEAVELPAIVLIALWCLGQLIAAADVVATPGTGGVAALWNGLGGLVMGAGVVHLLKRPERLRVDWWS